MFIIILLLYL